jgi:hypothetical protein
MSVARYGMVVTTVVLGSLLAVRVLLADRLDDAAWPAIVLGGALAAANTLVAYLLASWALAQKGHQAFFRAVVGGMGVRMLVLLLALLGAVLGLGLPRVPLVVSLLSYFSLFLFFELSVLNRRTSAAAESR